MDHGTYRKHRTTVARLVAFLVCAGAIASADRLLPGQGVSSAKLPDSLVALPDTLTVLGPAVIPPDDDRRMIDVAGLIDPWSQGRFEQYLEQVAAETGTDIRIQLHREVPNGDLESFALGQMRVRRIGDDANRRGVLFVYDLSRKRLRIEIGPGLEGVFPDGFVGYLMRDGAATFFASNNANLALRTTLFIMNLRLREAALGDAFNQRAMAVIDSTRLAAGAGATAAAGPGMPAPPIIWHTATAAERARFSPQPTPEAAFRLYVQWLREGGGQLDVPLFTGGTEALLRRNPESRAFQDFILYGIYGRDYRIVQRGDLAMLAFTSTPFVSPSFFRRTPAGWEYDLPAEFRNTSEAAGGRHTWFMVDSKDEYMRAFGDQLVLLHGYARVKWGDNRPLPVPQRSR